MAFINKKDGINWDAQIVNEDAQKVLLECINTSFRAKGKYTQGVTWKVVIYMWYFKDFVSFVLFFFLIEY